MASRAFTTRFMITCSICRSSTRTGARSGPCSILSATLSVRSRLSRWVSSESVSCRLMTVGRSVCLREKARSCRTSAAARLAFWRICIRSPCSTSATSWRMSSRSQWPLMAVRRLLKSCATPPASWPTACIFWLCTNCASSVLSSVASETTARSEEAPSSTVRVKATCRKTSGPSPVSRAISDRPRARPFAVSARRSAMGRPSPSRRSAMSAPGRARSPSKQTRRLVGVGEPPAGLEPRQSDGQILEEMVGHEAGDLGAVQRHQQQVAPAVGAGKGQRAHRLAGGGEHVHPVGAQRRIGEDRVEVGAALHQGGGGGVLLQHPALGVDAQPGEAGVREARDRGGRRAPALEAPEKRAAAHAGHHHPSAVLGLLHRDAVQPRLAGQPVARRPGGEARLRPGAEGGGIGAEDATLEVADHDRLAMAVEAADRSRAVARHQGEEAGAKREEVAAENEERDGKRAGNDGGPRPELGQRRGEQQRPRRREPRAGPEVAAQGRGPCLSLVLHQSARPLASGQSRPNFRVQPQVFFTRRKLPGGCKPSRTGGAEAGDEKAVAVVERTEPPAPLGTPVGVAAGEGGGAILVLAGEKRAGGVDEHTARPHPEGGGVEDRVLQRREAVELRRG